MNNIYLIGMMGCGKSFIGKEIAQKTNRKSIDVDEEIVKHEGISIREIFEDYGEEHFRKIESAILKKISIENDGVIVSCGGGVILIKKNISIMKKYGKIVYIKRDIERILSDVDISTRPLLQDGTYTLETIFEQRKRTYEKSADVMIENNDAVQNTVHDIISIFDL
ncbi:MAG: shikimate kinase [Christensenellaceae bacterium]